MPAASGALESSSGATEADTAAVDPAAGASAMTVDPATAASSPDDGVPVVVRLDLTPTGTAEERAAQVSAAIDRLLATMPAGSVTDVSEGLTVATVPMKVDPAGLEALSHTSEVASVRTSRSFEPAAIDEPVSPSAVAPSSSGATIFEGADVAWAAGSKGAGATVAVIDTGVVSSNPFLTETPKSIWEACFARATGTYVSGCPGGVPMSPTDGLGSVGSAAPCPATTPKCTHGTHVAGIAVGGTGTRAVSGIAPAANLVAINVFSYRAGCTANSGCITTDDNEIIDALQWLYTNSLRGNLPGLSAVNMSLGDGVRHTGACDDDPLKPAIDQLATIGVRTVVAAGNDSWTNGVSSPACISSVIAVGAVDDTTGGAAWFSNAGPQVAVMAAGVSVCSSVLPGAAGVSSCTGVDADGPLGLMSGTSMATPAVAGAIGLLKGDGVPSAEWESRLQRVRVGGGCVSTASYSIPTLRVDVALGLTPTLAAPCAPGIPTAALAAATAATVSWREPVALGTGTLISSTATASTGQSCTVAAPATSCTVTGLPVLVDITFTVRATSTTGTSGASGPSNSVRPLTTAMEVPLAPARIADSRPPSAYGSTIDGQYLGRGPVLGGTSWTIDVAGRGGVPSNGVGAVVLNVTATDPTVESHLRVYPSGSVRPNASNLNFVKGQTVANLVVSGLGPDGSIVVYNQLGAVDVVVDVTGWYPAGNGYSSLVPARLLDTRPGSTTVDTQFAGGGPIDAGDSLVLTVAGRGGVPIAAGSVVLNVTVVAPTVAGFLTVYPHGAPRPDASNLNFLPGQTVPNAVIAAVGDGGRIDLFDSAGSTDVVVDVMGWMPAVGEYHAISPERLVDTRTCPTCVTVDHVDEGIGPIGVGSTIRVSMVGRAGIPADAYAVVVNVTAVAPTVSGYLTVYPTGVARPTASNLNFVPGRTVPNLVVAGIGVDGSITIYNANGATQVVVDVAGWYS